MNADNSSLQIVLTSFSTLIFETPTSPGAIYAANCATLKTLQNEDKHRRSILRASYIAFEQIGTSQPFYGPLWYLVTEIAVGYHSSLPIWYGPQFWEKEPSSDTDIAFIFAMAKLQGGYDEKRYIDCVAQYNTSRQSLNAP